MVYDTPVPPPPNGLTVPWNPLLNDSTATAACSGPLTRRNSGTASRRSTFTWPFLVFVVTVIDATTPPVWSPGAAFFGTVSVNGSLRRSPGGIVTLFFGNFTHEPTSVGFCAAGRRSSDPDFVLNASDA